MPGSYCPLSWYIEGVTGTTHWDETSKEKPDYREFQEQMTDEVAAACEGALNAGAVEILVKDAHDTARNIIASKLPEQARLIRGWSDHPLFMVEHLDETFDAVVMIGYHCPGGLDANPLAHTMSGQIESIRINGAPASEFLIHAYAAGMLGVPVVFVSGDDGLCRHVNSFNEAIQTVAVKQGIGGSTISIHPKVAIRQIKTGVESALKADRASYKIQLPKQFHVEVSFKKHEKAYKASHYPGVSLSSAHTVSFENHDYFEVLRTLTFIL
ncbi:MAG: M55 family metallopeptidase [Planctomycetota bacterium]|nr:M55 family metallopeptidase [Planctomycetota bacterium]